jgi:predicted RNA-binding Zn-ribbon protein involved in translation (DUF1610 family)
MKNISLSMDADAAINVKISDDVATEVFQKMSSILIEAMAPPKVEEAAIATQQELIEASAITTLQEFAPTKVMAIAGIEPESIPPSNPFRGVGFYSNPKLVGYKCPQCGEITVRMMTLGEDNVTHCHFCRAPVTITTV